MRLEDELDFRIDPRTEALIRTHSHLAARPAGERVLGELVRLGPAGYERLAQLGLLVPLGGSVDRRLRAHDSPEFRLVAAFGRNLGRLPVSNEVERYARTLLRARPPAGDDARSIHRFRRETEPWALEALAFVGAPELREAVLEARACEPDEPLVRGDELGLPPGPEIGRMLALIEEERAAGTIATREEAMELARRHAGAVRQDG